MLCHVPQRSRLPTLFPQDAYFITFMMVFAVSNGYLVSLTMCLAPRSGDCLGGPGGGGRVSSLRGASCRGLTLLWPALPRLPASGPRCASPSVDNDSTGAGASSLGLSFPICEVNGLGCSFSGPTHSPNSQWTGRSLSLLRSRVHRLLVSGPRS